MKPQLVYLSGPIEGQTYKDATGWRRAARERLAEHNIEVLDPMRGVPKPADPGAKDGWFIDPAERDGISETARCRHDVLQYADAMIANFSPGEPGRPFVGSLIEIGWADTVKVPIVLITGGSAAPASKDIAQIVKRIILQHTVRAIVGNLNDAIAVVVPLLQDRGRVAR